MLAGSCSNDVYAVNIVRNIFLYFLIFLFLSGILSTDGRIMIMLETYIMCMQKKKTKIGITIVNCGTSSNVFSV